MQHTKCGKHCRAVFASAAGRCCRTGRAQSSKAASAIMHLLYVHMYIQMLSAVVVMKVSRRVDALFSHSSKRVAARARAHFSPPRKENACYFQESAYYFLCNHTAAIQGLCPCRKFRFWVLQERAWLKRQARAGAFHLSCPAPRSHPRSDRPPRFGFGGGTRVLVCTVRPSMDVKMTLSTRAAAS